MVNKLQSIECEGLFLIQGWGRKLWTPGAFLFFYLHNFFPLIIWSSQCSGKKKTTNWCKQLLPHTVKIVFIYSITAQTSQKIILSHETNAAWREIPGEWMNTAISQCLFFFLMSALQETSAQPFSMICHHFNLKSPFHVHVLLCSLYSLYLFSVKNIGGIFAGSRRRSRFPSPSSPN